MGRARAGLRSLGRVGLPTSLVATLYPAPWKLVLDGLLAAAPQQRLGHALLLVTDDEESLPFRNFLKDLFKGLLCLEPRPQACGDCVSCRLLSRGLAADWNEAQHPDALFLEPENTKGYSVDQIRALSSSFQLTRSLSPARLCRIHRAELLSASGGGAANALLKLLEEPRPHSFLLLTTAHLEAVLPTLRSRCQMFKLAGGGEVGELDSAWNDFVEWTLRGAGALPLPLAPPDFEGFWEDRETAVTELEAVYQHLWRQVRPGLGNLPREASLRVLDLFAEFESLIRKIRGFAAPALQWSQFKNQLFAGTAA